MLILSMIILIYVFAEKNHIGQGGEKKLRTLNLIGAVLPLFNIAIFALSRGDAASLIISGAAVPILILAAALSLLHIFLRRRISAPPDAEIRAEAEPTPEKPAQSYDTYALILSVITLPALIFIYATNVTETEQATGGMWAATRTVTTLPDGARSAIVILLALLIGVSIFLTTRSREHTGKATMVRIIDVINLIGGVILLSL